MKLKAILLILLISILLVGAQDAENDSDTDSSLDIVDSYSWLKSESDKKDWDNNDIKELSFAILALNNKDYDVTDLVQELYSLKNTKGCWPKNSCNTIDTSLAILALHKTGRDVSGYVNWLERAEKPSGITGGKWVLQFIAPLDASGNCKIICDDDTEKDVSIDDVRDINGLCGSISDEKRIEFEVDCSDVGGVSNIALQYKIESANKVETFFIQHENYDQATITVDNTCFPGTKGGSCDLASTLYASWVLKEIEQGEKVHTVPYLVQNIDDNPLHMGLLYLITGNSPYGVWLANKQEPSGSFRNNLYTTSIVSYALIQNGDTDIYSNSTEWINKKQRNNNWNNKILDTSVALIALYGEMIGKAVFVETEEEEEPEPTVCSIDAGDECESDTDCGEDEECDPLDCSCIEKACEDRIDPECVDDYTCGLDEYCDIYTCTCEIELDEEVVDEEEKSWLWLWILIIILLLGGGFGAFYYFNYTKKGKNFNDFKNDVNLFISKIFKKKPKKSLEKHIAQKTRLPQKPVQKPFPSTVIQKPKTSKRPASLNKVEKELEKSLKEAKKLLGKK